MDYVPMAKSGYAECPKCGNKVREENLKTHLRRVHGAGTPRPKAGPKGSARARPVRRANGFIWAVSALVVVVLVAAAFYFLVLSPQPGGNNGGGNTTHPVAIVTTSVGIFKIELYLDKAPITAQNFMTHVNASHYDSTIVHRVAAGFVVQMGNLLPKGITAGQIPGENTGLKNELFTVAMARQGDGNDPQSSGTGTSQFFVNLKNNPNLDNYAYPYVVFGKVIEGWATVEGIGAYYPYSQPSYDGPPKNPDGTDVQIDVISIRMQT